MKKETLKTLVIGILAGIIIAGGTGTVIAYSVNSNNVNFRSADSAWKVNTVADAIDDLYIKKTGDNYSTEERVVGTWIDGKPLYQRTFEIYKDGNLNGWTVSGKTFTYTAGLSFIDTLVSNECITANGILTSYGIGTTNIDYDKGIKRNGTNSFDIINGQKATFTGKVAILTIQYTKTTDSIPTENNQG